MAPVLTVEMLNRALTRSLGAACDAQFALVDQAVKAGRMPKREAPGAYYLIIKRAARRAGTLKTFRAKLPSSFTYPTPGFYVAAPLSTELIHTIMQFADGRTLARFSLCSLQLRRRADKIASEGLARVTTNCCLSEPAVADWKTELRLFAVLTNPPSLRSLLGPGTAWAPIRDQVKGHWAREILKYAELKTDYGRKDHRAYMFKYALRLGDRAMIEGVLRTMGPGERSELPDHYLGARTEYLIAGSADEPTDYPEWCWMSSHELLPVYSPRAYAAQGH